MHWPLFQGVPFPQVPTVLLEQLAAGCPCSVLEGDQSLLPQARAIAASLLVERRISEPGAMRL